MTPADKRAAFRKLHESGCFMLPNPWDVGSAVLLQHLGFAAIASPSARMAWSRGRPDYKVDPDAGLPPLSALAHPTQIPRNADFRNCFPHATARVAHKVSL